MKETLPTQKAETPTPQITRNVNPAKLGVGDSVTWTHCTSSGHSMGFSAREGRIVGINCGLAYVKMRNGRETHVLLTSLRAKGEKTQLTEMVEEMGASARGAGSVPSGPKSTSASVQSKTSSVSSSSPEAEDAEVGGTGRRIRQ